MSAALCYRPDARRARLYFGTQAGAYNQNSLIDFVRQLRRSLRGQRVTLLWDGLPSHRSGKMKAFLRSQRSWLVVEPLSAYAPDLNPVEFLWGNVKGNELANRCDASVADTVSLGRGWCACAAVAPCRSPSSTPRGFSL